MITFIPARDRHFTGNQYWFIIFIPCLFVYINLDNNYNNTIRLFYGAISSLDEAKLTSHLACLWWTTELLRERWRKRVSAEVDLLLPLLMYRPIQLCFTSRLWCSSCFRRSIPSKRARTHTHTHTHTTDTRALSVTLQLHTHCAHPPLLRVRHLQTSRLAVSSHRWRQRS